MSRCSNTVELAIAQQINAWPPPKKPTRRPTWRRHSCTPRHARRRSGQCSPSSPHVLDPVSALPSHAAITRPDCSTHFGRAETRSGCGGLGRYIKSLGSHGGERNVNCALGRDVLRPLQAPAKQMSKLIVSKGLHGHLASPITDSGRHCCRASVT